MMKNIKNNIFEISVVSILALLSNQVIILNCNIVDNVQRFQYLILVIVSLIFLIGFMFKLRQVLFRLIIFMIIIAIPILYSILLNFEYLIEYSPLYLNLLVISLPIFTFSSLVKDYKFMYKLIMVFSYEIFALTSLVYILNYVGILQFQGYNMALGYYLLYPLIIFINMTIKKFNIMIFTFIILNFLLILLMGSRGPLVIAIIYLLLNFFSFKNIKFSIATGFVILFSVFIIIFVSLKTQDLNNILGMLNLNARSISLLIDNRFSESDARIDIYLDSIKLIGNRIITGYGFFGERIILDTYPHNIILEIFINFGLVIGSTIIIFISLMIYSGVSQNRLSEKNRVINLFIFVGLIPLFISGSYLSSIPFMILMGLLSRNIKL